MALALTNLGRDVEAATELAVFLDEATTETPRAALEHARVQLAAATVRLARLAVVARDSAVVRVDGKARGRTPLARPLWLLPGAHTVTVARAGRAPYVIAVMLVAGELREVTPQSSQDVIADWGEVTAVPASSVGSAKLSGDQIADWPTKKAKQRVTRQR